MTRWLSAFDRGHNVIKRDQVHMSYWSKRLVALLLCLPLIVASGCLDLETGVAFNKDLTGKASFKMAMDLGPFAEQLIQTMGARGGEPPPPEMLPMIKAETA